MLIRHTSGKGSVLLLMVGLIAFFTVILLKIDRQVLVAHGALQDAIQVGGKEIMLDSCMRHTLLFCQQHTQELIRHKNLGTVELEYRLDASYTCSTIILLDAELPTIKATLYQNGAITAEGEIVLAVQSDIQKQEKILKAQSYTIR
ncbi:hypothetical protein KJZ61_02975 [Candidatus Dependentiae bacterium]|nr:hypothetical protein [Candidatus Dependentiae bacterium]